MNEKNYDRQKASFLLAVETCMPRDMSGEVMQCLIQNPEALKKFLAELSLIVEFDPNEFFQIREGLWVSDNFRKYILSNAKKTIISSSSAKLKSFDLSESMKDREIRSKLGKNHVWEDVNKFCSQLAGMINLQSKGEKGDILTNNYCVNIFYVRGKNNNVFVVFVYRFTIDQRWSVHASRLAGYRWSEGDRAFSCN